MGLKSAKYGVKAQLRSRFPEAFKECSSLADARDLGQADREETIVLTDGNVLFMSVPQVASTVDEFTAIITNNLKRAIATSKLTVVVFDEPAHITEAKKEEQRRRDAARQARSVVCSSDLASEVPVDDKYDVAVVEKLPDVHALMSNRGTRNRFIDEVVSRVFLNLEAQNMRWRLAGFTTGDVLFDGVDPRGAARPISEERSPVIFGTNPALAALLAREHPVGEGDLKIADLGRRIRQSAAEGDPALSGLKLSLATTIDTDSLAIETIEEAKRAGEKAQNFNTILCMKERARKREPDGEALSYYTCVDVSMLHTCLQRLMWGINAQPSPVEQRASMTLMAIGWALCGSDFVELKGMRSDVVFEAMPIVSKVHGRVLAKMHAAWSGKREDQEQLQKPLRCLLAECAMKLSDMPRTKKQTLDAVREPDAIPVRRAAWLSSYWNSVEFKGDMADFGFCADSSE